MNNSFFYKESTEISPDLTEVKRYLGYRNGVEPEENVARMIEKAATEMQKLLKPQGVFEIFPVKITDFSEKDLPEFEEFLTKNNENPQLFSHFEKAKTEEKCSNLANSEEKIEENSLNLNKNQLKMINFEEISQKNIKKIIFADMTIFSKNLGFNLKNSSEIALLAATIGPQVDAYIRRATASDSVYAAICQATGAMYIEQFVDLINDEIKNQAATKGKTTTPRFSPGYGDINLSTQKDFFRLLNCSRIGLTLMDTLIMAPEKSVTAFVGLK